MLVAASLAHAAAAHADGWSGPYPVDPTLVSCATATSSVVAGDSLLDGQASYAAVHGPGGWQQAIRVSAAGTVALACPTASFCMALDENGDAYTWNVTAWSGPTDPGLQSCGTSCGLATDQLSCPTVTFCAAVDVTTGNMATFNGQGWSPAPAVPVTAPHVSCASAAFCAAVGENGASVWDGSAWSAPQDPAKGGHPVTAHATRRL